jgi:UDP-N-acetylglucosamine acyltransferase
LIDPRAIVDPAARLAPGVSIGPWTVIGADVEIGEGTSVGAHVVVKGPTRIGRDNRIFPFSTIGEDPQDKKYGGEAESRLEIGDRNVIREYCTLNRGTAQGGGVTSIGDDNWILAYVHIAHDCKVGSHTVFANNATLAGHVSVQDYAILGGFAGVHQFCRIGAYAFCAIAAVVVRDVPPYVTVAGNTAKARGLNREGLKRHGFTPDTIEHLRRAYRVLCRMNLTLGEAMKQLADLATLSAEVARMVRFIEESNRGIIR